MDPQLMKTGACSIILGHNHYSGFFPPKSNKLLKVTRYTRNHDELVNMNKIRSIINYDKYFIIPDEELFEIKHGEKFYEFLEKLIKDGPDKKILMGKQLLYGSYINYGGSMDLHDSIVQMDTTSLDLVWTGLDKIIVFSKQIMLALSALHAKKICHLDIKPENIMVSLPGPVFKIIDFGFSSEEPFNDFVANYRGTPGYFPKIHKKNTLGLPEIDADDFIRRSGQIPLEMNRKFVYKIDTYCFGRTLLLLYTLYNETKTNTHGCSCFNIFRRRKIDEIIQLCLEKAVHSRYTIDEIISLNIL